MSLRSPYHPPSTDLRTKVRIGRAIRALLNEKKKFGCFDDGGGKRYLVGIDFVRAGANEEALEHFRWFDTEFPDDIGEPVFLLYRALVEYRATNTVEARRRLMMASVSNLYLLPHILGQDQDRLAIWHSSNWEGPEYLNMFADELAELTQEEKSWIQNEYESKAFRALRSEYVAVFGELLDERDVSRRTSLLNRWRKFESKHCASGA